MQLFGRRPAFFVLGSLRRPYLGGQQENHTLLCASTSGAALITYRYALVRAGHEVLVRGDQCPHPMVQARDLADAFVGVYVPQLYNGNNATA